MDVTSVPAWLSVTETGVKILAIAATGGWAVFLFRALRQSARARLELDKLGIERDRTIQESEKLRRDIAKLDLEMKRQAVVGITVTATQIAIDGDVGKYLLAVVEVTNRGTRAAKLSYEEDPEPFTATAVLFSADGQPTFGERLRMPVLQAANPNARALSTIVRAGASEMLPFVCRVKGPGMYFVTFRVQVSPEEREELDSLGVPTERPVSWTGKAYVVIN